MSMTMRMLATSQTAYEGIQPLSSLFYSVPFLVLRTIRLVSPHTHAVSHDALDNTNLIGSPGRVVRNLDQRIVRLLSIRLNHHTLIVIRDILTRSSEQLAMYKRWK